ncbi:MAG: peptidoglycan-associated lipoprotein Pal [Pseudomonadota bacterium]
MTIRTVFLGLTAATLVACGSTPAPLPEVAPVDDRPPAGADRQGNGSGLDDGSLGAGRSIGDDSGSLGDTVIYFEYDRSEISPQYAAILAEHARRLAAQPGLRVRLEGHADERGSREYNIGLGERRALAVRRVLLVQGASAGQLSVVSFGEERPAALGSNEEAYRQNRRVALVYR